MILMYILYSKHFLNNIMNMEYNERENLLILADTISAGN